MDQVEQLFHLNVTLPWPTLNGYRLAGDISHVLAILVLIISLIWKKDARGVSGKTQLLYTILYSLRYMDLWWQLSFISYYNSLMKISYIVACSLLVYLIYTTYRHTYDLENDSFQLEYLMVPVTILAFLINYESSFVEICWTWSIYMEAVALVPQLYMIWNSGYPANSVIFFIMFMGIYRGLYICNWAYRYYYGNYYDIISVVSGIIETSVAFVGFIAVFSLKLRLCTSMNTRRISSIYTLPHIAQQMGKDYKRIPPPMTLDLDDQDIVEVEKRAFNKSGSHITASGVNNSNSASMYYVL